MTRGEREAKEQTRVTWSLSQAELTGFGTTTDSGASAAATVFSCSSQGLLRSGIKDFRALTDLHGRVRIRGDNPVGKRRYLPLLCGERMCGPRIPGQKRR